MGGIWARLRTWALRPSADRLDAVLFAGALLVVGALPWFIAHWPAVDLHNHLAVAHVIDSLSRADSPYAPYLTASIRFVPNNGFYAVMVGLHQLFTLDTVGRILLSFIMVGIPLATLAIIRRAAPDRWRSAFLVFPLLTGKIFMLGFVSYFMSFTVALIALAVAWPPASGARPAGDLRALAVAGVLLVLAAWFHPFAAGLTCFALLVREWRGLLTRDGLVRAAVCVAPVVLFVALTSFTSLVEHPPTKGQAAFGWDGGPFVGHDFNGLLDHFDHPWAKLLRGLPLAILGAMAVYRSLSPQGSGDLTLRRVLLGVAVLYIFCPDLIRPDFFIISPRVMIFGACLAAAMVDVPHALRRLAAPCGLLWLVTLTAWQTPDLEAESDAIGRMAELAPDLPQGSTLLPVVFGRDRTYSYSWDSYVEAREVVVPYLMAGLDGEPLGFRALGYKKPLSGDFLPDPGEEDYIDWDTPCENKQCEGDRAIKLSNLLEAVQVYDHVLLMDPPPDFLPLVSKDLALVRRVGEFHLMRPLVRRTPAQSR